MNVRTGIVLILFFLTGLVQAQNSFLAYRVTGPATLRENNRNSTLKTGKIISGPATLIIGKGGSVLLVCENSAKSIKLKEGTHQLGDLKDFCNVIEASLSGSFLKYVWWQLTNPDLSPEEERKRIAGVGGGVSRGCSGIEINDLFDTISYYQQNMTIRWNSTAAFSKTEVVFYEYENSPVPLLTFNIKDQSFRLDSLKGLLEDSAAYFWNIRVDDQEVCPRKLLQVWNKKGYEDFIDNVRKNSGLELDKAEENYMLGYFLELEHLYAEAYNHYWLALQADPGNERYKRTVARLIQSLQLN